MNDLSKMRAPALEALNRLLCALDQQPASLEPEALKRAFQELGSRQSKEELFRRLNLTNKDQYEVFAKRLRQMLERTREHDLAPTDALAGRNAALAQLRFLCAVEGVQRAQPALAILPDLGKLDASGDEERARRQARALELILRSLISERYGDQESLVRRLRELFSEPVVRDWLVRAGDDNVLAGTAFSELATIFVDQKEFAADNERLYKPSPFLTLLRDKRKTITDFLNDIRVLRNALAHHKKLSNLQIRLLDIYYDELVTPVQDGFDHDQTRVDPQSFLDTTKDDLERYFGGIGEDMQEVRDSIGELAKELNELRGDVAKIREDVGGLGHALRKHWWLGVAGMVLLGATFALTLQTSETTGEISAGVRTIDRKLDNVKQETSQDPRKELANLGIAWSKERFVDAIKNGDLRLIGLFLDGGINLQENFTALNIAMLFQSKRYQQSLPVIEFMRRHGVDFLKDFDPASESHTPLTIAASGSDEEALNWLLTHGDRSVLVRPAVGERLKGIGMNSYWCATQENQLRLVERLAAAGVPAAPAYRTVMERYLAAGSPLPDLRGEESELAACEKLMSVLRRFTPEHREIDAAVRAGAIVRLEEQIDALQREIVGNRRFADGDMVTRIDNGRVYQLSYGRLKQENNENIQRAKARIKALSAGR